MTARRHPVCAGILYTLNQNASFNIARDNDFTVCAAAQQTFSRIESQCRAGITAAVAGTAVYVQYGLYVSAKIHGTG